jgi:uncharacterized protein (TIGR01777 family)
VSTERARVVVSGSTGLIGSAVVDALGRAGYDPVRLVRGSTPGIYWDPDSGQVDTAGLEAAKAVVHLAGEPIGQGRWTAAKKDRIRRSRTEGTALLARTLGGLDRKPQVLVCASAIGYYGDRADEELTEASAPGTGFLADVVQAWEAAAAPAAEAGIRVVNMRTGIVLSARGGALPRLLTPFRLGLGGRIGPGTQYMSWVACQDVVGAILRAIDDPALSGPVNVVGPAPVTNTQFATALGRALHRPAVLPLPALAARVLLGTERARELLLVSQRVLPTKLLRIRFEFAAQDIDEALTLALRDA